MRWSTPCWIWPMIPNYVGGNREFGRRSPPCRKTGREGEKKSIMKFHKHKCKALYLGKSVQHKDQLCERGLFWKGTWEIWGEPSLKEWPEFCSSKESRQDAAWHRQGHVNKRKISPYPLCSALFGFTHGPCYAKQKWTGCRGCRERNKEDPRAGKSDLCDVWLVLNKS